MDLIRVDAHVNNAVNTFLPYGGLIEDYDSLVWTEKFQDHSEFILTTSHIDDFRLQLPIESFVTLLQSLEVMKVESHTIGRDQKGKEKLTIRGRSVTSILENRVIQLASPSKTAKLNVINADRALVWLVIYSTVKEYTSDSIFSGAFDPNGISGGFEITGNTPLSTVDDDDTYWIPAGVVDRPIRSYLEETGRGMAFRRPDGKSGYIFDTAPLSSTLTSSITEARFDLREPDNVSDTVIFDVEKGHFTDVEWIESVRNAKTVGYLNVPNTTNMTDIVFNPAFPNASSRTKLGLLGYSHESSLPGDETEGTTAEIKKALKAQMRNQLKKEHPYLIVTGGQVSSTAPFRYLEHYALGDVVGVYSVRYGFEKKKVTEFIRSWESGTESAYPVLSQNY